MFILLFSIMSFIFLGCYAAGVLPLVVAVGAIGLMFVQVIMMIMTMMMMMSVQYLQLTKLRDHLRNPDMSSDEYRYKCRKTFWRMVSSLYPCIPCIPTLSRSLSTAAWAPWWW